jgi:hypothetical protein
MRATLPAPCVTPRVHTSADSQPLARRQYQVQTCFRGRLPLRRSGLNQGEPHRLLVLQPFAPSVEGLFDKPLLFAELVHGQTAALLLSDPLTPILASRRLPLFESALFHATNM